MNLIQVISHLCRRWMPWSSVAALAMGFCTTRPADAAPTFFTDETAFQAAAGTSVAEGFEAPFSTAPAVTFTGFTVTETSVDAMLRQSLAPLMLTDGQASLEFRSDGPSTIVFNFASPVSAFGITIKSFGNTGGGTLSVITNVGMTASMMLGQSPPQLAPLNEIFFGVVNTAEPFTSVTFTSTSTNDIMTFDGGSYSTATVIPEPSSAGLGAVAAGVAMLYGARRRRKGRTAHTFRA
jgi:hypothetical protein